MVNRLTEDQKARYARNILLAGIGYEGQLKLINSSVLLIGAGGLGSPAAFYLAAAGVGRIGIMDGDIVELSNLNRQILHTMPDLGKPKVESAKNKLLNFNQDSVVEAICGRLTEENASSVLANFDVVIDCSDSLKTRFIINDTCLMINKPFIYGGVLSYFGQVMTIIPGLGPCFRCLYRDEPKGNVPDCSTVGVLGATPGVIGVIQACEAIKYIVGLRENLYIGRLLTYDSLTGTFMEVKIERDQSCPSCSQAPNDSTDSLNQVKKFKMIK